MAGEIVLARENFATLINSGYLYIDKTEHLREFLGESVNTNQNNSDTDDSKSKVMLFTRPRRFGKTLTMSMIENFFQLDFKNPGDSTRAQQLFSKLNIYQDTDFCKRHMAQYPVISLTLKSVEGQSFFEALSELATIIHNVFKKFSFLSDNTRLTREDRQSLHNIQEFFRPENQSWLDDSFRIKALTLIKNSLSSLTALLNSAYGRKAIVLIDEYDVPLQKARLYGYYDEMLGVIRGMFGNCFKTNDALLMGVITGCLRISHESIFTGVNNFTVFSVFDRKFSDFIGFTQGEVHNLLGDQGLSLYEKEVALWYDGYNFSGTSILCPWSVLNFCSQKPDLNGRYHPQNYWAGSSGDIGNDIIEICLKRRSQKESERLQNLITGGHELIAFPEFSTYPEINPEINTPGNFDLMLGMMLHTGYLTVVKIVGSHVEVKIPNQEVLECFKEKARQLFSSGNTLWDDGARAVRSALLAGNAGAAQHAIDELLINYISVRDSFESFYHGFMLGVLNSAAALSNEVSSNLESGLGYSDIFLRVNESRTAVVLELKHAATGDPPAVISSLSAAAFTQIRTKQYPRTLLQDGYTQIYCYAIVFQGKNCFVALQTPDAPAPG